MGKLIISFILLVAISTSANAKKVSSKDKVSKPSAEEVKLNLKAEIKAESSPTLKPKKKFKPKTHALLLAKYTYQAAMLMGKAAESPAFKNRLNGFNLWTLLVGIKSQLTPSTRAVAILKLHKALVPSIINGTLVTGLVPIAFIDQQIPTFGLPFSLKARIGMQKVPFMRATVMNPAYTQLLIEYPITVLSVRWIYDLGATLIACSKKPNEFSWTAWLGLVNGEGSGQFGSIGNYKPVSPYKINRSPTAVFRIEVQPLGALPSFGNEFFYNKQGYNPLKLALGLSVDYTKRTSEEPAGKYIPANAKDFGRLELDAIFSYDRFFLAGEWITQYGQVLDQTTGEYTHLIPASALTIRGGVFIIPNVLQLAFQYNRAFTLTWNNKDHIPQWVEAGLVWYITPGKHNIKWIILSVKDYVGKAINPVAQATIIGSMFQYYM